MSVPAFASVTQTLAPSKRADDRTKPTVTFVTVQGIEALGVTIETVPLLAVQIRAPSKVIPKELLPRFAATSVACDSTAPSGSEGSIV
jgi:hypothetical protein